MNRQQWQYIWQAFAGLNSVDRFERMRACAGALIGITVTGLCSYLLLGKSFAALWLMAPMGASAVLLFALPASPLAQPWSLVGGNLAAGFVGVTCAKLIGDPIIATGVAAALAISAMFWLRCIHPPSGAVALTAVLGGTQVHELGYRFLITPVGLNSLLLLLVAILFNNATGRRYPHIARIAHGNKHALGDPEPMARSGFTPEDLDAVISKYNQVLDISRDDLEQILLDTEMQAYRRRFGVICCADFMSRDVVSVEFGTKLRTAWDLLHAHRLSALPVIARGGRVIGIVTLLDFVRHAAPHNADRLGFKLRRLLRVIPRSHSSKPEVVGQIMSKDVSIVKNTQTITELVPLMSDAGLHTLPVVDQAGVLVGVVTQSDLIAALYETSLR